MSFTPRDLTAENLSDVNGGLEYRTVPRTVLGFNVGHDRYAFDETTGQQVGTAPVESIRDYGIYRSETYNNAPTDNGGFRTGEAGYFSFNPNAGVPRSNLGAVGNWLNDATGRSWDNTTTVTPNNTVVTSYDSRGAGTLFEQTAGRSVVTNNDGSVYSASTVNVDNNPLLRTSERTFDGPGGPTVERSFGVGVPGFAEAGYGSFTSPERFSDRANLTFNGTSAFATHSTDGETTFNRLGIASGLPAPGDAASGYMAITSRSGPGDTFPSIGYEGRNEASVLAGTALSFTPIRSPAAIESRAIASEFRAMPEGPNLIDPNSSGAVHALWGEGRAGGHSPYALPIEGKVGPQDRFPIGYDPLPTASEQITSPRSQWEVSGRQLAIEPGGGTPWPNEGLTNAGNPQRFATEGPVSFTNAFGETSTFNQRTVYEPAGQGLITTFPVGDQQALAFTGAPGSNMLVPNWNGSVGTADVLQNMGQQGTPAATDIPMYDPQRDNPGTVERSELPPIGGSTPEPATNNYVAPEPIANYEPAPEPEPAVYTAPEPDPVSYDI